MSGPVWTGQLRCKSQAQNNCFSGFRSTLTFNVYLTILLPQVAGYCRIDLDQASMEGELAKLTEDSFRKARDIYENGGHSMPLATLTLVTPLTQVALKGANFTAYSVDGMYVAGRVLVDQEPGSSILQFEYTDPSLCQVGGLGEGDVKVTGCLAADGVISSESGDYQYTYNPLKDNKNGRTLATISQMSGPVLCIDGICVESFRDYYGTIIFAKVFLLNELLILSPLAKGSSLSQTSG